MRNVSGISLLPKQITMINFIDSELSSLRHQVNEMWMLVYNQLDRAGEAVLTLDRELAKQVVARERRVNASELKLDSSVEDMISLYTPVGVDLRFVLAVLKINSNLERIGDFAEGAARFVEYFPEPALDPDLVEQLQLDRMITEVLGMLRLAKEALDKESLDLATQIFAKDDVLDKINADAPRILADYIAANPESALTCLHLLGVIRKMERAGDHITNIAEEIVFFVDAKVLKHKNNTL